MPVTTPQADTLATVSLSASSLSFGSQPVAITSAPVSLFLTNSGSSTLKISTLTITGGDTKSFAQTSSCGSSVAAGQYLQNRHPLQPSGKWRPQCSFDYY